MKALIIIDMFERDVRKRKDASKLIGNQLKLIDAFNKAKLKVILVGGSKSGKIKKTLNLVMLKIWGEEMSKEYSKNKIVKELLNTKYDYYINKKEYSAFYNTPLSKICKREKIKELFIAGISSGCCLFFSAADAAMRGIYPYIVSDASGAPSLLTHNNNLKKYDLVGGVISTRKLISKINS
jgi:isochorismate hydrolase